MLRAEVEPVLIVAFAVFVVVIILICKRKREIMRGEVESFDDGVYLVSEGDSVYVEPNVEERRVPGFFARIVGKIWSEYSELSVDDREMDEMEEEEEEEEEDGEKGF